MLRIFSPFRGYKILTKKSKYDILSCMKFRAILLFLFLFSVMPVFALDVVETEGTSYRGKILAYTDGLIRIKSDGTEKTIIRSRNADFFGDYIKYTSNLFTANTIEQNCRISFIDTFYVDFISKDAMFHIPRYRVKLVVLDAR